MVEAVAPMISAEDARRWSPEAFNAGVRSPEALVRRVAAMALGRVGDTRGTALLIPLLQDPDSTVQTAAAFALGLVRDTAAVGPLIARLAAMPPPTIPTGQEIVTALAKIGGPRAAELVGAVLDNTANVSISENRSILVLQAAVESWRLGAIAPTRQLLALAQQDNVELRWRVIFSLGQLRSPDAGEALLNALRDAHPLARGYAARGLTASYAATARLEPDVVVQVLLRATTDEQPGVRINALRSLGTFARPDVSDRIAAALTDPMPNVQVAAASTMGLSGGPIAAAQLSRVVREGKGSFALQREALLGLSRASADSFRAAAAGGVPAPDGRNAPPRRRDGAGWHPAPRPGTRTSCMTPTAGWPRRHSRAGSPPSRGLIPHCWRPRARCSPAGTSACARSQPTRSLAIRRPRISAPWRPPIGGLREIRCPMPRCRRWKLSGRWPTSHRNWRRR